MTFAESAALVGIPVSGESIVVSVIDGKRLHQPLTIRRSEMPVSDLHDSYFAAGAFREGTVTAYSGRKREHLKRIYAIPIDCDLADFLGVEKSTVYSMPQEEIEALLPAIMNEAYFAAQMVHLPITTIIYTGHGIQLITVLTGETHRLQEIAGAVKVLIKKIADVSPGLVDKSASDAGTRLFRVVGTLNSKSLAYGQPARRTRVLEAPGELLDVADLLEIGAVDSTPSKPAKVTPLNAIEMPADVAGQIVSAIAPHWQEGQRHALSLAVAGMLAKAGVPEAQAIDIVSRLSAGDEQPGDRATSVATTYARHRTGSDVRGYFALRDFVPATAVDYVDGILERFKQSNTPRIIMPTSPENRATSQGETSIEQRFSRQFERTIAPVPESAFYGWFGAYRDLMKETTAAPDQFHLGSAFVLTSALTNRRVRVFYNNEVMLTNLFVALIGRTGTTFKDTAMKRALEQLPTYMPVNHIERINYQFIRDVSSQQGLIKNLSDKTNAILKMSEMTTMLRNAKRKSTETILDAMITSWDGGVLENNAKLEPLAADSYQLNVIAATQPGRLANQMTSEEIESGFANRWIYVFGQGKTPRAITEDIDPDEAGRLLVELRRAVNSYMEGTVLRLDSSGRALFTEWFDAEQKAIRDDGDEDRADMRARHANLIMKLGAIYAISAGAPAITDEHIQPAIDFIGWMWGEIKAVMRSWGASLDIQLEERIREVLEGGPISRRDLQRKIGGRKYSARDFAMTLDAMSKNRTVEIDPSGLVALS